MSALFTSSSSESIALGTGVNFSGGNDGAYAYSFFRPTTLTDGRIINKSSGVGDNDQTLQLAISTSGAGTVKGIIDGDAVTAFQALALLTWHFAAITYDGADIRLYYGNPATGVLTEIDSVAKVGNIAADARPTRIGSAGHDTTIRSFNGKVAYLGVGNEALTFNELQCILSQKGHDTVTRSRRYLWRLADRAPGIVIGASQVVNVGPIALANGSGTNTPLWSDHDLSWMPQPL